MTSDNAAPPNADLQGFAKPATNRLGGERPVPFIGKPVKMSIYRARSVTAKHASRDDSTVVWWVLFEINEQGAWGNASLRVTDTELFQQLSTVLGFSPADMRLDQRHEFKLRPEIHVSQSGPHFKLQQICAPTNAEMIAALRAHAEKIGALTANRGWQVDQILREQITQVERPNYDAAFAAIDALMSPLEKVQKANETIKAQVAAGKEAAKDPHYATATTQEHQDGVLAALQEQFPDKFPQTKQPDPLLDGLKASGASEVAVEDTDPLSGNGGTNKVDELQRDEHGDPVPEHSTYDPDKMCFAIPKYIKRELDIDLKDVPKHVKALFRSDVPHAEKIREMGVNATWRMVEQYVARFKTQEENLAKKPAADEKPQEETVPAPVRPSMAEIDAARAEIKEYFNGIKNKDAFLLATGYPELTAAIEAGKSLETVKQDVWNWVMENERKEKAESAANLPANETKQAETPAKPSEPISPKISPVETRKPDADGVIEADIVEPSKALAVVQPSNIVPFFDPNRAFAMIKGKMDLLQAVFKELLQETVDYGKVPGTDKLTLLKPGAEKLLTAFDFYPMFKPTSQSASDWQNGIFFYEYECVIYNRATGRIEGSGIGNCSSMESKYRWRKAERTCPQCGKTAIIKGKEEYGGGWVCFNKKGGCGAKFKDGDKAIESQPDGRVENPDIFDQVNTISKMAQKRALVAATLNATGASWRFTQDVEDLPNFGTMDAA